MGFKYKIYRLIVKNRLRYKKYTYNKIIEKSDKINSLALNITTKLLSNKESILLMCPKTNDRYLLLYDNQTSKNENATPETFVTLEYGRILIINHQYYYNIEIVNGVYKYLLNEFDKETERRRRKMKKDITDNVINSLLSINQSL